MITIMMVIMSWMLIIHEEENYFANLCLLWRTGSVAKFGWKQWIHLLRETLAPGLGEGGACAQGGGVGGNQEQCCQEEGKKNNLFNLHTLATIELGHKSRLWRKWKKLTILPQFPRENNPSLALPCQKTFDRCHNLTIHTARMFNGVKFNAKQKCRIVGYVSPKTLAKCSCCCDQIWPTFTGVVAIIGGNRWFSICWSVQLQTRRQRRQWSSDSYKIHTK